MDSGSITEHDDEMFCRNCYRKLFGPKGYGFGGLHMDDGNGYVSEKNKVDHKAAAYVAPTRRTLAEANGNMAKKAPKAAKPKWGGAETCPRCEKSVFIAELMRGAGKAWHKSCFTCLLCKKRLDSSILCEREGEIYCRREWIKHEKALLKPSFAACYGRNFGPKGFGFGINAGVLQMSS